MFSKPNTAVRKRLLSHQQLLKDDFAAFYIKNVAYIVRLLNY